MKNEKTVVESLVGKISKTLKIVDASSSDDISAEKLIFYFIIFLSFVFLYMMASEFQLLLSVLEDASAWDFSTALFLIPFLYLPLCIYFLLQKTKTGWILTTVWITYTLCAIGFSFLYELQADTMPGPLNDLTSQKNAYYIVEIIIYGWALYSFNQSKITTYLSIGRNLQCLSIIPITTLISLQWLPILL